MPKQRDEAEGKPLIALKPKWETRLPEFLAKLNELRGNN
jgi:hypothetical protein